MNNLIRYNDLNFELRKEFNYYKQIIMTEEDFRQKGTKFQIVQFRNREQVKQHYHKKTTEVFLVINGEGIININGNMNRCSQFDTVICNPGDIHSFLPLSTNQWFTIAIFKTNEEEGDIYNVEV